MKVLFLASLFLLIAVAKRAEVKENSEPQSGPESFLSIPIKENGHGLLVRFQMIEPELMQVTVEIYKHFWFGASFGKIEGGTDIFVLQEDVDSGEFEVIDMQGVDFHKPTKDSEKNYELVEAYKNETYTTFVVERQLYTEDGKDYIIRKDREFSMGFAYGLLPYSYHKVWGKWKMRIDADLTIQLSDPVLGTIDLIYQIHGILLYISWGAMVIVQIGSVRYIRFKWRWNMWIHAGVGILCGMTTVFSCFKMLQKFQKFDKQGDHTFYGFIFLFMCNLMISGGVMTRYLNQQLQWKTSFLAWLTMFHKYFAYAILIWGHQLIFSGMKMYTVLANEREEFINLFYLHLGALSLVFIICESIWKQWKVLNGALFDRTKQIPFFDIEQYEAAIRENMQLCTLDDLILDISEYMPQHPAGQFVIEACIGRDMGKFFYGGYKMDQNEEHEEVQRQAYRHSMSARLIVRQLVIGKLVMPAPEAECRILKKVNINRDIANFYFKSDKPGKHWSLFYQDIKSMGRLFLLHAVDNVEIQRQYTICTSARHDFMKAILHVVQQYLDGKRGEELEFDKRLVTQFESDTVVLTIKNYNLDNGLSKILHNDNGSKLLNLKGPMGKGLAMKRKGTHIAFSAGTGALLFLDLVVHLARRYMGILTPSEEDQVDDEFKLVFFASFRTQNLSIGKELCELVQKLSDSAPQPFFEYHCRLSTNKEQRWDTDFVYDNLFKYKNIKKIWVRGTPLMNDLFSRILSELYEELRINKYDFDIV